MAQDQQIQLQTDTLSSVPGGGIRTVGVNLPLAGQQTGLQQQVVSIADANGAIIDGLQIQSSQLGAILSALQNIEILLATWMGVAVVEPVQTMDPDPMVFPGGPSA